MPRYEPNLTPEQAAFAAKVKYARIMRKGVPISIAAMQAKVRLETWIAMEKWGIIPESPEVRKRIADYFGEPEDMFFDTSEILQGGDSA